MKTTVPRKTFALSSYNNPSGTSPAKAVRLVVKNTIIKIESTKSFLIKHTPLIFFFEAQIVYYIL